MTPYTLVLLFALLDVCGESRKSLHQRLMHAVSTGSLVQVKHLIQQGARINTPKGTFTPLMCAAKKGHTSILKYLLRKGAKTRATDRPGYLTALLYAKNYRCVEALLEAGASANESNIDGGSVLGQWVYKNTEEAERIVKLLVHRGADVNAEEDGQYVLNSAVEGGRIGMVRSLLEYGADANAEDDNGVTPLSIAQRMKRRDLVALLKRYGAE